MPRQPAKLSQKRESTRTCSKLKFFTAPKLDRIPRKLHRTDGNVFRVPSTHRSRCIPVTETLKVEPSWEKQPSTAVQTELSSLLIKGDTLSTVSPTLLDRMFDQRFLVLAKDSSVISGQNVCQSLEFGFISVDTTYTALTQDIYLLTWYITWLYILFSLARNKATKK